MITEQANAVAASMQPDPRWYALRWVTVCCDLARAEALFRNWAGHLGCGAEAVPGKRARFERFLQEEPGRPVYCPVVRLVARGEVCELRFIDGMHRFCVLRDAGAVRIPLTMTRGHARLARQLGLAAPVETTATGEDHGLQGA